MMAEAHQRLIPAERVSRCIEMPLSRAAKAAASVRSLPRIRGGEDSPKRAHAQHLQIRSTFNLYRAFLSASALPKLTLGMKPLAQ